MMKTILKDKNQCVLRLDKGEELIESLKKFCKREKIKAGFFWGLGSAGKTELAHYDLAKKKYFTKRTKKILEILNLVGNIGYKKKDLIIHAHILLGNEKMRVLGGHVNYLVVGATCEIFLTKFKKSVKRKYSREIGLNLLYL